MFWKCPVSHPPELHSKVSPLPNLHDPGWSFSLCFITHKSIKDTFWFCGSGSLDTQQACIHSDVSPWNLSSGECKRVEQSQTPSYSSAALMPSGNKLVTILPHRLSSPTVSVVMAAAGAGCSGRILSLATQSYPLNPSVDLILLGTFLGGMTPLTFISSISSTPVTSKPEALIPRLL